MSAASAGLDHDALYADIDELLTQAIEGRDVRGMDARFGAGADVDWSAVRPLALSIH